VTTTSHCSVRRAWVGLSLRSGLASRELHAQLLLQVMAKPSQAALPERGEERERKDGLNKWRWGGATTSLGLRRLIST
jgi:hypothetical protein